jgi:hypothetical protein
VDTDEINGTDDALLLADDRADLGYPTGAVGILHTHGYRILGARGGFGCHLDRPPMLSSSSRQLNCTPGFLYFLTDVNGTAIEGSEPLIQPPGIEISSGARD